MERHISLKEATLPTLLLRRNKSYVQGEPFGCFKVLQKDFKGRGTTTVGTLQVKKGLLKFVTSVRTMWFFDALRYNFSRIMSGFFGCFRYRYVMVLF